MQRINVRLPDALLAAIEAEAAEKNLDVSKVVRPILSAHYGLTDAADLDEKTNPELPLS